MAKEIIFPDIEPKYLFERDSLSFPAKCDGKPVECWITVELLMAQFRATGPSEMEMRESFRDHRSEILDIAKTHIENGWFDEAGRIVLTTRFTRMKVTFGDGFTDLSRAKELSVDAQRILTTIIGPNAESIDVSWNAHIDPAQLLNILCEITDPITEYSEAILFPGREMTDRVGLSIHLARLWGSILRARSRKLIIRAG